MAEPNQNRPKRPSTQPGLSKFPNPLNVVVEKFGDGSARVCGAMSKETLRDLLMPSLTMLKDHSTDSQVGKKRSDEADEKCSPRGRLRRKEKLKKMRERARLAKDMAMKPDVQELHGERSWIWSSYYDHSLESLPSCESSDRLGVLLSFDGKWLRKQIEHPLRLALREVVAKKPYDPVAYLSFWLLNYRQSQEYAERKRLFDEELQQARSLLKQSMAEVEQAVSYEDEKEQEFVKDDVNFVDYEFRPLPSPY